MKRALQFAVIALVAAHGLAQSGGVILNQPGTPVVLVAPTNGATSQTVAVTNSSNNCFCQPVYDPVTHRVFFFAQPGFVSTIFAANILTGAVTSAAVNPPNPVSALVWDPVTARIISITGFGPGPMQVTSIDPDTGAYQVLFTTTITNAHTRLAIDPATRRLFVISDNSSGIQKLHTVSLVNGAVTTVSIAAVNLSYESIHYDPLTNKLIALAGTGPGVAILSIDPVTGAIQTLVPLPMVATVPLGMAFEPISRLAVVFDPGTYGLRFVNVDTGSITTSAPLPGFAGQVLPAGFFAVPPITSGERIPSLGTVAMILLALTFAALALRRL